MKPFFTFLSACILTGALSAQCFVQVTNQPCTCFGSCDGSANSFPVGTGPWNFLWSPGGMTTQNVTGLCAGTYTIQITSQTNGCTATATTTVNQPAQVTGVTTSQPATSCINCNGMASVSASGGNGPYTYNWSPSGGTGSTATGLCPFTYTVTITDANSCTGTATVTVGGPQVPFAVASCNSTTCFGGNDGTATVNVTGGSPPYTYLWMPGNMTGQTIVNLSAACYTVTVTGSNGCTTTASCCVTEPPQLTISASSVAASCQTCCDGSVTTLVNGGAPPYTYMWTPNVSMGPSATSLCPGTYTVCVTDANGCTSCTATTITYPVGLDEPLDANVSFYPNPAGDELNLILDKDLGDVQVMIYNIVGDRLIAVKQFFIHGKPVRIDVKDLSQGIYFVEVRKGNMTVKKKFAKL